jgi:hypothetical protein
LHVLAPVTLSEQVQWQPYATRSTTKANRPKGHEDSAREPLKEMDVDSGENVFQDDGDSWEPTGSLNVSSSGGEDENVPRKKKKVRN